MSKKLDPQTLQDLRAAATAIRGAQLAAEAAVGVVRELEAQAQAVVQAALRARGLAESEYQIDLATGAISPRENQG